VSLTSAPAEWNKVEKTTTVGTLWVRDAPAFVKKIWSEIVAFEP